GAVAGAGVSLIFPVSHKLLATGVAVLAAGIAVLAFGLVVYLLNDGDLRAAVSWLRQVTRGVPEEVLPVCAGPRAGPPGVPRRGQGGGLVLLALDRGPVPVTMPVPMTVGLDRDRLGEGAVGGRAGLAEHAARGRRGHAVRVLGAGPGQQGRHLLGLEHGPVGVGQRFVHLDELAVRQLADDAGLVAVPQPPPGLKLPGQG